jgi:signal transduction histidine kinase
MLAEAFVGRHADLLDRLAEVAGTLDAPDSTAGRVEGAHLLALAPAVRRLWITSADGTRRLNLARDAGTPPSIDALLDSVDAHARSLARPGVNVFPVGVEAGHAKLIGMTLAVDRHAGASVAPHTDTATGNAVSANARPASRVALLVDADSLRAQLRRTAADTRTTLIVLSGADTLVRIVGAPRRAPALVGTRQTALARLPDGGTWTVLARHALTTRPLRWGMWTFGVAGMLFLAFGLLREQQRALHVAARSVELERLYSDVKRANQAKSEFLANVSHELRTPLNAIVGFVELLRDGFYGDLSPRQVPPVDRIAASATHLRHLVDQVLDIAKIAAGRLEVHSETIVLRPFVLNVASELESLVSEKGLALSITVGASLPRVRTDPTHLRQILINLIGNAVKYTPAGSVSVRARLLGAPEELGPHRPTPRAGMDDPSAAALLARAPRSGIWVALQVIDTGVGIAASDLNRIFDEFEQVNAGPRGDSMQRGTGLGLAISRRLARLLGGDITVESVPGRGSTFTIWLPVSPSDLTRERPLSGEMPAVPPS